MPNQTASTIDSAANQLTECPNCETVFRVTDQQLRIASGQVRCGSCLHIFVASQHWVSAATNDEQAIKKLPDIAAVPEAKVDSKDPAADRPDPIMPASALKQRATIEFSDAFMALETPGAPDCSLGESGGDDAEPADEEDWALRMLEAEAAAEPAPGKRTLQAIRETPDRSTSRQNPDHGKAPTEPTAKHYKAGEFATTESWMQELLGGGEAADSAFEAPAAPANTVAALEAGPDEEYVPEIFRANSALLEGIQAEPLEVHWHRQISPWVRHGLILLGLAAAAIVLLAQYTWFNAEHLAANPRFRPLLTHFCQLSGCTMPAKTDISRIKNSNLVVVKHPRVEDALLLDTILTNHAGFEQPFPVLHVRFSNLQDETVAARSFSPDEYLRGDLAGERMMPVRQPIHLSLELRDPGDEASNYRVQLLPADQG